MRLKFLTGAESELKMKSLFEMTNYCDCCHKNLLYRANTSNKQEKIKKIAFPVETTEGRKYLCSKCILNFHRTGQISN